MNEMKIRPLNDTDLASNAFLDPSQQYRNLSGMARSFAPFTLTPIKNRLPDIFNLRPPMFEDLDSAHVGFERIDNYLIKRCKTEIELENNRRVGELIHAFSLEQVTFSRWIDIPGIRLGALRKYWLQQQLVIAGQPVLAFIDPRGGSGLSPLGRKFVFSAIHWGLRELDPAFENAKLLILQLPKNKHGERRLAVHWEDGELVAYEDLESCVSQTEQLWIQVQIEEEERRRTG